jgi:hypothetical protein
VERNQIVARQPRDRVGRAGLRQAVRVEAVDQPIEHGIRDEPGVVEADLERRQQLLALALDFRLGKRRTTSHLRQHAEPGVEAVLHHHHVEVAQVGPGARAGGAADEVDRVVEFFRRLRRGPVGPLVEKRRCQVHEAGLAFRIR